MTNFWIKLRRPFYALAPMEDVTDTVFRQIICSIGRPDVMFTEFANVEAILHGDLQRLKFTDSERPLVTQIWGTDPQKFYQAAVIVKKLGFDGIDINLGCPVKDVVKQGACSAMIGDRDRVREIISATREAGLPVSVKTRIGTKKIVTNEWIGFLPTQNLAAITVHGRTVAEKSAVPVHWEEIGKAVSLRNQSESKTLIIGNGDVDSIENGKLKMENYGVDGVMIGRGVLSNPAVFADRELSRNQRFQLLFQHINLWDQTWGTRKNFTVIKKFIKAYVNGFIGASLIRQELIATHNLLELKTKLRSMVSYKI